ncbi:MAG: YbdK family carboxylate-amine ligase [Armatimonadota bacterium]
MGKLEFRANDRPTLGVELEVALVDAESMALTSGISRVLEQVPAALEESIKPELMQCYLEINSCVCGTVADAERDLSEKIRVVERITDDLGLRILWSGTHPFSRWSEQELTPTARYQMLLDLLQDTARQLVTFGLHVHVGVDSGDKAVMVCDRILPYLPLLLAVSANSPCWDARITGLKSSRSKVMEGLPTAGLPEPMRNWSEYTWLVNHLIETGFIHTIREIWWDVRPHHNFGTVEVRICDMPPSLDETLGLVALVQCLVQALSEEIDEGTYQREHHPMMVRQNKWRACRFGRDAELVDPRTLVTRSVPDHVADLGARLAPIARRLGCVEYLQGLVDSIREPGGADRQLDLLRRNTGDPAAAVREMLGWSRLTPPLESAGRRAA